MADNNDSTKYIEIPSFKVNKQYSYVHKNDDGSTTIDLNIPSIYYKYHILTIVDGKLNGQRITDNYSRNVMSVSYNDKGVPTLDSIGMWNVHFTIITSVVLLQILIVYYIYKNYKLVRRI